MTTTSKNYLELIRLPSFIERLEYLRIPGAVGVQTFGSVRFLNQDFYRSKEWRRVRRDVILRDGGCDLAHLDHEIVGRTLIHHIDPITKEMVMKRSPKLLDPNNLVLTSLKTHKAIHYGAEVDDTLGVPAITFERSPKDTALW